MQILFNRKFLKHLAEIPTKTRTRVEELVFIEIPSHTSTSQISGLEKLKGYAQYYRIRVGDYPIGIKINPVNSDLSFERILHRKEIYKFFP